MMISLLCLAGLVLALMYKLEYFRCCSISSRPFNTPQFVLSNRLSPNGLSRLYKKKISSITN